LDRIKTGRQQDSGVGVCKQQYQESIEPVNSETLMTDASPQRCVVRQ
jgi:hypothetical protein